MDFEVFPANGLLVSNPTYLGVSAGTITDASWTASGSYYALWWEVAYGDGGEEHRYLYGNEYQWFLSPGAHGEQRVVEIGVDVSATSALAGNVASFAINDRSQAVNFCDDPGVPLYQTCAGGLVQWSSWSSLDRFVVNVDRNFTWTLYDSPPPAAVPEPETWALLVIGVALAGGMTRRVRGRRLATLA